MAASTYTQPGCFMKTLIVLVLASLFLLTPESARACSCMYQTPCEAFSKASVVFIGRVLGGTEKVKDESGQFTGLDAGRVRFAVEEVFKGSVEREVQIHVASMSGTSCGPYGLYAGQKYLVYAYSREDSDQLSTGVCTRTTQVSENEPKQDMDFLRNLPAEGSGGRLFGKVLADQEDGSAKPIPGITVLATSADNRTVRVITNDKGEFEFTGLKAGTYRVNPVWPEKEISTPPVREATVPDRGCVGVYFELSTR